MVWPYPAPLYGSLEKLPNVEFPTLLRCTPGYAPVIGAEPDSLTGLGIHCFTGLVEDEFVEYTEPEFETDGSPRLATIPVSPYPPQFEICPGARPLIASHARSD